MLTFKWLPIKVENLSRRVSLLSISLGVIDALARFTIRSKEL